MSFFYVDIKGQSQQDRIKTMIVEADSLAVAKVLAGAQFDGDSPWSDGAEITSASADFEGWSFKVRVGNTELGYLADGPAPVVEVEYIGAASDTADLVGAALATALNAHGSELIAGAAYNTGSNVLTIAETTDGLGDRSIEVIITPPGGKAPIDALRTTLVQRGSSGDALKCTLVQPTKVPVVIKQI